MQQGQQAEPGFLLPVGTVTLLLADIEGSTRRWESRPAQMSVAVARHDELVTECIARHGGVRPVEQGEGDSFVAAFSRPSDALASALELQLALADERWPEGTDIRLRCALHTGEVQLRDEGNYIGQTVNRCARLRDTAHGGQTVLSQSTHELVVDRLPEQASLRELGVHRLGDLARPERVYQLCHPALPAEFPPLRSLDARASNLPPQLTSFIGREAAMTEVRSLLREARLVTLSGSGGCGKTRLALQVAGGVLEEYPDGVWFVDLAPVSAPDLVAQQIASVLQLAEGPLQEAGPAEMVARHIGSKRVLVVLDNCEHVISACAGLVETLLGRCPALVVLATSREPLSMAGEAPWLVPSLALPANGKPSPIESLTQYEAVQLFIDRATRARSGFRVTNENAPAVAEICQRLGGIPLAIELAAARLKVLAPQQVLDGLHDRFHLLTGGARTVVPRHQTLEASLDWSYDLLSGSERMLLRRLALFAGGFSFEAAEEVCAFEEIERQQILDLLSQLVDKSLVVVEDEGEEARYGLLESIRQYGRRRLAEAGEEEETANRHRDFYLALAERAAPELVSTGADMWIARLDAEQGNLRNALQWSETQGHADALLRLAGALAQFWTQLGRVSEGRRWLELALEEGDAAAPALRARVLWGVGEICLYLADLERIQAAAEEELRLGSELEDPRVVARALTHLGWLGAFAADRSAAPSQEKAASLAREAGDLWCLADALMCRGIAHLLLGEPGPARPLLEEAMAVAHGAGNQYHVRMNSVWLAHAALWQGDFAEVCALSEELIPDCRSAGDAFGVATGVWQLATALLAQGDYTGARARAEEMLSLAREQGNPAVEAAALMTLSQVARAQGGAEAARELATEAVSLETYPSFFVGCLCALAEAELLCGQNGPAAERAQQAVELASVSEIGARLARALHVRATVARAQGDSQRSESDCHQALALQNEHGDKWGVVDSLETLAELAAAQESYTETARLLAAAESLREAIGYVRYPVDRSASEAGLARLRDGLGEQALEEVWQEGAAMSLEEAVGYAERGRGERRRPSWGWESLTPAELEIARLVAGGLGNPKIAEKKFISRHTVESHLKHIYAKLGMGSRTELAAETTRRGLAGPTGADGQRQAP